MQERKRPMPVGIEDFGELIQRGYCFVDKTRFIQELLDARTPVTLITRPRRFGKTLSLSMLYYFFTLENADENRKLFDGCHIAEAEGDYMSEQGTRPVIFFSLKDIKEKSFDLMLEHFAALMQSVYSPFRYLMDGKALYPEELETYL